MKIVFDGTVLVSSAIRELDKISFLILEMDMGSGNVGEVTQTPDRLAGSIVATELIAESKNSVVLEFNNSSSIAVVIEKLQELLMLQK